MKMPVKRFTFSLLLLLGTGVGSLAVAASLVPVEDREGIAISGKRTPADVRAAILKGAASHGWQKIADNPGKLRLKYDKKGKHQVVIDVLYTAQSYGVKYVSSENMNFSDNDGERMIHASYAKWVNILVRAINSYLNHGSGRVTAGKDGDDD